MKILIIWGLALVAFLGFKWWYGGNGAPLGSDEIARLMERYDASRDASFDASRRNTFQAFLESDTGREFYMINVLNFKFTPDQVGDVKPGETSQNVLERYTGPFMKTVFARAGHPVMFGRAVAPYLEDWGIEEKVDWKVFGIIRYRSRKDMAELALNPEFEDMHIYKYAALDKTAAFPMEPIVFPTKPIWFVGLLLTSVAGILSTALLVFRGSS